MNKYKIIILLFVLFFMTGCTTYLKDEENKSVVYENTGQVLPLNIICKPNNEDILALYKDNKADLSKLEECRDLQLVSGEYEGLWTSFFVKPLAWLIIEIGSIVKNYGLSLIIVGILIRLLLYPVTKGTALQSKRMAEAKPEMDQLEKKYKDKKTQEDMMKKSQEMMMIYQKHKVNPFSSCLFALLQLPLFFAFLEAISRVPAIFEETFLTLQLGTTPLTAILDHGQFQYLLVVILLGIVTKYSFNFNNVSVNPEAEKQMAFMSKFLLIFIPLISFTMSTALSIYWITSSAFTIIQNAIVKRSDNNEKI